MTRTKQTPRGGSQTHRPGGIALATFQGRGRGRGDPEGQFTDYPEDIKDEDLPKVLEDAEKPEEGGPSSSKSGGKEGTAQAAEGALAPPEETPPDPTKTTAPTPAPTNPKPGTSTEGIQEPTQDPTQDSTQAPGEVEIKLTQYVKDYM